MNWLTPARWKPSSSGTYSRSPVLIVEDDPIIRMLAVEVVEDADFEVIQAVSADEAISILESRSDIRVVFTDIDLPGGLNGMRLSAYIRNRWPDVEIIVTSGQYSPKENDLPSRVVFILKPYVFLEVVKTLRDMVQQH